MCLYDEQSQICMDTVVGILSVFSCSLKRGGETERTGCSLDGSLTHFLKYLGGFSVSTLLCSHGAQLSLTPLPTSSRSFCSSWIFTYLSLKTEFTQCFEKLKEHGGFKHKLHIRDKERRFKLKKS